MSELENPIIRDWPQYPKYHYPEIHEKSCGCDRKAIYYVNDQTYCKGCMLEAVSTQFDVRVRSIL